MKLSGNPVRLFLLLSFCHTFILPFLILINMSEPLKAESPGRVIIARGDINYPPYEFLDSKGEPAGYNIEVFRAVADAVGIKAEIRLGPWDEVRKELEAGKIDMLMGMFYSEERDRLVDFSDPHLIIHHAIFARKDSRIKTKNDLKGKRIIVQEGDIMHDYAVQHNLSESLILVKSQPEGLKLLASGKNDCFLGAEREGLLIIKKYGFKNVITVGTPFYPMEYGFAVPEGRSLLLNKLNEGLDIIKERGVYREINEKWFGMMKQPGIPAGRIFRYALMVLIPVLILLSASALWTWSLKRQVAFRTSELRESQEKYRFLVENINDTIYRIDESGIVNYISPVVKTSTGYEPEEMTGNNFLDYIHSNDRDLMKQKFKEALEGARDPVEYRIISKSGEIRWIRSSSRPVYEKGRLAGLQGIFTDITEAKKMEYQLQQAQKMEAIGTLAGGIAHDFNNILSSIMGYTELALDYTEKGTNAHDFLQEVLAAGNRATGLTRQILAVSRHDEKEVKQVAVCALVREILRMLRATIPAYIEIRENICEQDLVIKVDSGQINQVIINLVTNALHAMSDNGGVLTIDVEPFSFDERAKEMYPEMEPGNYVRVTVSDTGDGISPEHIGKIFEPYFTTKDKSTGTGLGLSVVHGIVKSYKGYIKVYSELGKGSVFHVYLPLYREFVSSEEDEPPEDEELQGGTERILFIDDEQPIVDIYKHSLGLLGYDVITETDSLKALELFRSDPGRFDLVITDMTMPKMTGDRFVSAVKNMRPDIPVILCTGFSTRLDELNNDLNIDELLMKPVDKVKMAKAVRRVLEKKESGT